MSSPSNSAPSTTPPKSGRLWLARLPFLAFLIAGSLFFYWVTLNPLRQVFAARSWQETPCTVISSKVAKVAGPQHGAQAYKVDIFYHYSVGNTRYTTSHYQFASGGSSGQTDKQKIVDQYPAGRETVCYVNPANPSQAVINRAPNSEMFYGLIGLIFAVIGVVGLISSFRIKRGPAASA